MLLYFTSKYTATAFLTEMFFPLVLNHEGFKTKVPSMEEGGGGGGMDNFWNYTLLQNISQNVT